eukprot:m.185671 g.185671  ORF g.185671 m.185671 type:complete len:112 (-) comp15035_c1_seq1:214-549(-)
MNGRSPLATVVKSPTIRTPKSLVSVDLNGFTPIVYVSRHSRRAVEACLGSRLLLMSLFERIKGSGLASFKEAGCAFVQVQPFPQSFLSNTEVNRRNPTPYAALECCTLVRC